MLFYLVPLHLLEAYIDPQQTQVFAHPQPTHAQQGEVATSALRQQGMFMAATVVMIC